MGPNTGRASGNSHPGDGPEHLGRFRLGHRRSLTKLFPLRGHTYLLPVPSQPLIKQLVPTHLQCPALHPTCHPTQDPVTGRHGYSPAPTGPPAPHFRETQAGPRQGTTSNETTTRKPPPPRPPMKLMAPTVCVCVQQGSHWSHAATKR